MSHACRRRSPSTDNLGTGPNLRAGPPNDVASSRHVAFSGPGYAGTFSNHPARACWLSTLGQSTLQSALIIQSSCLALPPHHSLHDHHGRLPDRRHRRACQRPPHFQTDAAQLKDAGNKAFAAKNYKEADDLFSQAILIDPSNHVLWSNRSAAKAGLKDWDAALEDAEQVSLSLPALLSCFVLSRIVWYTASPASDPTLHYSIGELQGLYAPSVGRSNRCSGASFARHKPARVSIPSRESSTLASPLRLCAPLSSTIHRVPAVSHASFLDSHQHYFILSDPRFQTPITTNAFDSIQCVKLNPKWAKGYARKGAALHGAHKFSEAIAAYEAGIAIEDSPALQKGLKEVKEAQQRTS